MINNYCHFKSKIHRVNRNIPWFVPPTIKQIVLWIKVISPSLCHCVIYSQNSRNHLSKTAVKRGKVQKERNWTSKLNLVFYLTQSVVLFIFVCKSSTGWIVYKQSSIKIAGSAPAGYKFGICWIFRWSGLLCCLLPVGDCFSTFCNIYKH